MPPRRRLVGRGDRQCDKKSRTGRQGSRARVAPLLGVLQNSSLCDFYIGEFCTQSVKKLEPKLRDILRLGVYQLVFLDKIPPRAAVNESVALSRRCGLDRAAGLSTLYCAAWVRTKTHFLQYRTREARNIYP